MKTFSLAVVSMLLLGASARRPPAHGPKPPYQDACCCCDISVNSISCDRNITASDCICAAVVCPPGAPTIWHGEPAPRPTAPTREFYPVPDEPTA